MKNRYQKYLPLLEEGKMLMFREKDGKRVLIGGQGKDEFGDYKRSVWGESFEECLRNLGYWGYSEKQFNRFYEKNKWEFCGVYGEEKKEEEKSEPEKEKHFYFATYHISKSKDIIRIGSISLESTNAVEAMEKMIKIVMDKEKGELPIFTSFKRVE